MSDAAPTVVCPRGHTSLDRLACTVCGVPIGGPGGAGRPGGASGSTGASGPAVQGRPRPDTTPTAGTAPTFSPGGDPPPGPTDAGGPASATCPHCSAPLDEGSRFCEVCGYDPSTGSLPRAPEIRPAAPGAPAPPAAPAPLAEPVPASPLVAVITADRAYYESNQVNEVQFPLGAPARTIELPAGPVSIGRRSRSRGTNPGIDLAVPPEDPAVSHTHASLLPNEDGTWELVDHGSVNGTYLNESPEPIPANRPTPVAPGDRIYLGAWTRITLELR